MGVGQPQNHCLDPAMLPAGSTPTGMEGGERRSVKKAQQTRLLSCETLPGDQPAELPRESS